MKQEIKEIKGFESGEAGALTCPDCGHYNAMLSMPYNWIKGDDNYGVYQCRDCSVKYRKI